MAIINTATKLTFATLALGLFALGLTVSPASAQDADADSTVGSRFTLGGFGSLGVSRSSNDKAEYLRDVGQPKGMGHSWRTQNDSLLGVQADWQVTDQLKAVVQGVSHYRVDGSFSPELTWAFAAYEFSPRFTLRAGRLGTEFLIDADSRMVGYSYLPVRPPMDIYGVLPIKYGDGIDGKLTMPIDDGVLRADLFSGVARERLINYDVDKARVLKGSLSYSQGDWKAHYLYAQIKLNHNIGVLAPLHDLLMQFGAVSAAQALELNGTVSRYQSLGVSYDDGTWQVQGMLTQIEMESKLLQDQRAGYVQVARRIGAVNPFVAYSRVKSTPEPIVTNLPNLMFYPINAGVAMAMNSMHLDRKTLSLGARWDFYRNMDLKLQVDSVRDAQDSLMMLNAVKPGWKGHTEIVSLLFDFVF